MTTEFLAVDKYTTGVGSETGSFYGILLLTGPDLYALIRFYREGPLPDSGFRGSRYYGNLYFEQMPVIIDLLRNEDPIRFAYIKEDPKRFFISTGREDIGEGETD